MRFCKVVIILVTVAITAFSVFLSLSLSFGIPNNNHLCYGVCYCIVVNVLDFVLVIVSRYFSLCYFIVTSQSLI